MAVTISTTPFPNEVNASSPKGKKWQVSSINSCVLQLEATVKGGKKWAPANALNGCVLQAKHKIKPLGCTLQGSLE